MPQVHLDLHRHRIIGLHLLGRPPSALKMTPAISRGFWSKLCNINMLLDSAIMGLEAKAQPTKEQYHASESLSLRFSEVAMRFSEKADRSRRDIPSSVSMKAGDLSPGWTWHVWISLRLAYQKPSYLQEKSYTNFRKLQGLCTRL
jgi:hypothetical protein